MSMLKSKVAKVAVIFMAVAMTIVPLNAFAATQIERPTYQNKTVYCSLDTDFHFLIKMKLLLLLNGQVKKDILLKLFCGISQVKILII